MPSSTAAARVARRRAEEMAAAPRASPVAELCTLQGQVHRSVVLALDAPSGDSDGDPLTLASALLDDVQRQPAEVLEQRERATYVRDALACLPDRLKEVVVGYFLEGQTSADLAARLGVTESRVSQMRTEALKLMREGIEAQYAETQPDGRRPARGVPTAPASYAAELAARSTYAARLSQLPAQRRPADERVAGLNGPRSRRVGR